MTTIGSGFQGIWFPVQAMHHCIACWRRQERIAKIEYGDQDSIHLCADCAEALRSLLENMLEDLNET